MIRCRSGYLCFVAMLIFFGLYAPVVFSQETVKDSLTAELKKFEAKKAALGENATAMMDTVKVKILYRLTAETYLESSVTGLRYANQQLALSKKIGYDWGIGTAYNLQGDIYDNQGDHERALKLYISALTAFNRSGYSLYAMDVNNNIGILYFKKGIYTESLKYLLKALKIAKNENDYRGLVYTYNNIGLIFRSQDESDEALAYYLKSLKIQLDHKDNFAISTTYLNVGEIYRGKKQYSTALNYFKKGIKNAVTEDDNISLANNYSGIGNVYTDLKAYDKALENHNKALAIREGIDETFGMFTSYINLGNVYLKTGNTAKAKQYTQQALELVKDKGELHLLAETYRQLAEVNAAQADFKDAYINQKLFKQVNDSVFNIENQRKLTEQQMNFDFKNIQEKRDIAAKEALQNQKNIRNITLTGLSGFALAIIIFLIRRHKKSSARRQKAYAEGLTVLKEKLTVKELEAQALKIEKENIQLKNDLNAIEKEHERAEKEKLQEKLDFNRRELTSATLYLSKKNEFVTNIKAEIDSLPRGSLTAEQLSRINAVLQDNHYLDADWEKFRLHFEQVHPDFFKELSIKYPGLTNYEVRLHAYLFLKLSTKEIASLLNIAPASVHKAKMRLNKKLNSTAEETPVNE